MKNILFRKGLVFVVIFLFLGIVVQPIISINYVQGIEVKSTDNINDSNEDCNCNDVSNQKLIIVNRLLDKIEIKIKNILLKYSYIPDVKLKCNEILDILDTFGNDGPICNMLNTIYIQLDKMFFYFFYKSEESSNPILNLIYAAILTAITFGGITPIFSIAALLKCSWTYPAKEPYDI